MSNDMDDQINFCADLVSMEILEAFPHTLLTQHKSGEWVSVKRLCQMLEFADTGTTDELVATWLPDPSGDLNYVVIIFFDDETKASFAAHYNRSRLLGEIPTTLPED